MKVFVLSGHPNPESWCASMASQYVEAARAAGHEVRFTSLHSLQFDDNLALGYKAIQALEPDLQKFQADLAWAEHFVLTTPLWWGGMPARLKGLIDRTFLPGFAFKYKENSPFQDKLLSGKTARVLLSMDAPAFWYKWVLGQPLSKQLKRQFLGFSGFKPVKVSIFGPMRSSTEPKRKAWLDSISKLAAKAK